MRKYIIMLVAAMASLCAYAGEPFYKNIYADFTMGFSRLCHVNYPIGGGMKVKSLPATIDYINTRQYTFGIGYRISPRWNVGMKFLFDSYDYRENDIYDDNINLITTIYGEYDYLKWRRLSLSAIASASLIDIYKLSHDKKLGEVGFGLGADFKIIRQVQLIVRYGFFGFGIGDRKDYHYKFYYWDKKIHPGCYSSDRSGLTADFGIRRLQFGIRVNL